MPKTIDLPDLQDTDAIKINTGEMTAVAINAIKKEVEQRMRAILIHGRIVLEMRDTVRSYIHARIGKRSMQWQNYYDDLAERS